MKNNITSLYDRLSDSERQQLVKLIAGLWPEISDKVKKQYEAIPGFTEAIKKELEAS